MSIRKTQRINAVQGSIRRSVWVENVLSLPWIETRFHGRWVCTLVVVTVTYLCSWGTAVVTSRRSNRYSFRNVVCMMLPLPPETNFRALRAGFTLRRGIEGGVCVCVCVCVFSPVQRVRCCIRASDRLVRDDGPSESTSYVWDEEF